MRYLGGKSRLGGRIVRAILDDLGVERLTLAVDLCSGAGGVTHRLADVSDRVIAVEAHPGLVALHKAVQAGWVPPERVSEAEYQEVRRSDQTTALAAFVGFGCSFGGKWWGGYAKDAKNANYARQSSNALRRDTRANVEHVNADALAFETDAEVVYCDPPYEGTAPYDAVPAAPTGAWWRRLADLASPERACYLSEYAEAPPAGIEARLIWTAAVHGGQLAAKKGRVEKLWRVLGRTAANGPAPAETPALAAADLTDTQHLQEAIKQSAASPGPRWTPSPWSWSARASAPRSAAGPTSLRRTTGPHRRSRRPSRSRGSHRARRPRR